MSEALGRSATVAAVLAGGALRLEVAGVRGPGREARLLLSYAADLPLEQMIAQPDRPLGRAACARYAQLVERRARRQPLAQITGQREFWSLVLKVTPDTLTPRPESETLVEAALAHVSDRGAPLRLLDLGTGTGCLLLALLSELPKAEGVGVDLSEAAVRVARENATALGLAGRASFLVGDWGSALGSSFDLLVANPPYVPTGEIDGLEPEVAGFEPRLALAGGPDGLAEYRALARRLSSLLSSDGRALLEIGQGQGAPVADIMAAVGLSVSDRRADLAGIERCLVLASGPGGSPPGASRGGGGPEKR